MRLKSLTRNTRIFVAVSLLSGFGGAAMSLTAGVWVLDLTGSSALAGLVGLGVFAPTLAGPLLGAAADRLPRRALLVTTALLTAAALLLLPLVRTGRDAWLIFAVMLVYGVSYVLVDAAESALLPAAVAAAELGAVNGLRMTAQEGTKLVAPAAGAALYAWHGAWPVAALCATLLLGAATLYRLLRLPPDPPAPARRRVRARDGMAFLRADRPLRTLVLTGGVTIGASGFVTAAVYETITGDIGLPASFAGVLGSAQGAGSIAGSLAAGALLTRRGPAVTGALGAALFAASCLGRLVPAGWAAVACSVLAGVGLPLTLVAAMTAVQLRTPGDLLGRVSATASTLLFAPVAAAIPLGSAAVTLGSAPPLLLAAAACAGTAVRLLVTHPPGGGQEAGGRVASSRAARADRAAGSGRPWRRSRAMPPSG
ncbi:MFS transporter [Spirilliplanes yamanashiensis]|uniref:MFS transporter n=1 Tax=Spirilliplanes yamanashiensis TaxID=42233 RepID=A0A8J3YAR7_9ACTN|nr:MFS transporter [Spirilliplanes yamanashiensis]MDP9818756.1 MFS family permease [Spirilliplanes yamanashiensis]GIJ05211.1 MFS transporter [Spirilliplanes yamanashiensis]